MKQLLAAKGLLMELGVMQSGPMVIEQDNQAVIEIMGSAKVNEITKHIIMKVHFIRETVNSGEVKLQYVETGKMNSDGLTKALSWENSEKKLDCTHQGVCWI